jgi:hypothetical protein
MDDIPHIAIPISVVNVTSYATTQQDTNAEDAGCVAVILQFPLGYRDEAPDFGITDPTFSERPIDTSEIETQIETYEPRATIEISESAYDPSYPLEATVAVEVRVLTTEDE